MDIDRFLRARRAKRKLLTPRRREVLQTFRRFTDEHQYPPTVRELMGELGLSSPASVHAHLTRLESGGHLVRAEGHVRAWVLAEPTPAPEQRAA